MKGKPSYDKLLFVILMALLFMPMLQAWLQWIPLKPLNGVTIETERPQLSMESYRSGDYGKQLEQYLGEHYGFREPTIRLYNQYLWTCYRKTYAKDVAIGKQGWLYYPQSVSDYYGTELLRWQPSVEAAQHNFDLEVKYMNWARTILKENGVELLAFMAPEKGFLYPEYLPDGECDTTNFNAREYFEQRFAETGFPCIEMTRWFQQMKDTVDYPLIPQTGAHWVFPAVYAADSLFRFMGDLKGEKLPAIKIGELHQVSNHGMDNDLEHLLNLTFPIRHRFGYSPRADVSIERDSTTVKPKVLFIGNSFFWGISSFVPLDEVFENVEFWYYFSTAYSGKDFEHTEPINQMNVLERLLDFDYVVWFTTGNQMYKGTSGFAKSAVLNLCIEESKLKAYIRHIADEQSVTTWQAKTMLFEHPEMLPELRGDSLTVRNGDIPYAKIIKDIRKDSVWVAALEAQGFLRTATLKMMLRAEAAHIMEGKPLYRDQQAEIQFARFCQQEIEALMSKMRNTPSTMEVVEQQAIEKGQTLEKTLRGNAEWLIRRKYKLHDCKLLDDPDAQIPLPPEFQSEELLNFATLK